MVFSIYFLGLRKEEFTCYHWYKLADVIELTIFTDDPILPATQAQVITPRPFKRRNNKY
jgi:hypothetical protein